MTPMALQDPGATLILDYPPTIPSGTRLMGDGWLRSGVYTLHIALGRICDIMNKRA